jgi:hypothetical protein
VVKRE